MFLIFFIYAGCANQQPPPGGEDDKIPPVIKYISPAPNTINFKGNKITIAFDEYFDRRSFLDAFSVTPKISGGYNIDISGKEAEISFKKSLAANTTYLFTIGKSFSDIRGNPLAQPIQFAISTGNHIDKGSIEGYVFTSDKNHLYIFAYKINDSLSQKDVTGLSPDYLIQVNDDGSYKFNNLNAGIYHISAVVDNDRNGTYNPDIDYIFYSGNYPVFVSDSIPANNINFVLKDFLIDNSIYSPVFYKTLKGDSLGLIYSNISDGEKGFALNTKFYFYFKNKRIDPSVFLNSFSLTDSLNKSIQFLSFTLNDSLIEILPVNLKPQQKVVFTSDLRNTIYKNIYNVSIKTAGINLLGDISGVVNNANITSKIYVVLFQKENRSQYYMEPLNSDNKFNFKNVTEGEYLLYVFEDKDGNTYLSDYTENGIIRSERFVFYPSVLNVKGGWNIENISINF